MIALVLLVIHIAAGFIALLTAFVALVTAKGGVIHVRVGRVYAIGMAVIFLTAIPLAALGDDVFLLLIAFFSLYLVLAGWCFARNRSCGAQPDAVGQSTDLIGPKSVWPRYVVSDNHRIAVNREQGRLIRFWSVRGRIFP